MPKLIVKQETERSAWSQNYLKWLSITGFGVLLLFVASMVVPDLVSSNSPSFPSPSVDTASNSVAKSAYQLQQKQFSGLDKAYKDLAAVSGGDDYQQNLALHYQTGTILQQLDAMDSEIDQMGLAAPELAAIREHQQYLQDYWQAEQHFRQLRLVHFEQSQKVAKAGTPVAVSQADAGTEYAPQPVAADSEVNLIDEPASAPTASRFLAAPPPGVELPAGFCTLDGPNACKPGADD